MRTPRIVALRAFLSSFILSTVFLFAESIPKPSPAHFSPPAEFVGKLGDYRSPLRFNDDRLVKTSADWAKRREEILRQWNGLMGDWPKLLEKPKLELVGKSQREGITQHKVRVEVSAGQMLSGILLVPEGKGPFPAVLVPFYDAETGAGLGKPLRDFGWQLSKRGFVTLSIGSPGGDARKPESGKPQWQPLSYLAYVAANCHTALAQLGYVDASRIGVAGHSYGGKWAMFAACFYDKFACGVWSDPGIMFDETRSNINYWEPWYLGRDEKMTRKPGVVTAANPRTGAYKMMVEQGRDLHEVQALMSPRPFLVSGGAEDSAKRWVALNHIVAVNTLLGHSNRVAMTNRPMHDPTEESNAVLVGFFEQFLKPSLRRDE